MGYAKIILFLALLAQKYPERQIAREGNRLFEKGDIEGAAARYDEALRLREEFTEARFNLGNTALAGEKIDQAIELYKQVLRTKPDDRDAKYNLAYAQKLKDQQDEQEQEQQPEQQEGGGENQPQEHPEPEQGGDQQPHEGQPQLSEQEAEQMLEAMQAEEGRTRDEIEGEEVKAVGRSGKNW